MGLIYPVVILAVWGLYGSVVPFFKRHAQCTGPEADILESIPVEAAAKPASHRLWPAIVVLLLCLPTTGVHVANCYRQMLNRGAFFNVALNYWVNAPRREVEAMRYLAGQARDFPMVLSAPNSGVLLPAFAPVRTYLEPPRHLTTRVGRKQ